jgi:hypothetical protein
VGRVLLGGRKLRRMVDGLTSEVKLQDSLQKSANLSDFVKLHYLGHLL